MLQVTFIPVLQSESITAVDHQGKRRDGGNGKNSFEQLLCFAVKRGEITQCNNLLDSRTEQKQVKEGQVLSHDTKLQPSDAVSSCGKGAGDSIMDPSKDGEIDLVEEIKTILGDLLTLQQLFSNNAQPVFFSGQQSQPGFESLQIPYGSGLGTNHQLIALQQMLQHLAFLLQKLEAKQLNITIQQASGQQQGLVADEVLQVFGEVVQQIDKSLKENNLASFQQALQQSSEKLSKALPNLSNLNVPNGKQPAIAVELPIAADQPANPVQPPLQGKQGSPNETASFAEKRSEDVILSQRPEQNRQKDLTSEISQRLNNLANNLKVVISGAASKSEIRSADTQTPAPVAKEGILSQIVQKAQLLIESGKTEMRIHLKPEHLGQLTMQILVENGGVTAKFTVQSTQVKEMLEANLPALKQSLQEQGLKVESLNVMMGSDTSSFNLAEQSQQFLAKQGRSQPNFNLRYLDISEEEMPIAANFTSSVGPLSSTSGIDYRI